ncbi:hypothetical protein RND81_04G128100 [Saponaria officinalis]|uniref:intramembrane prenyl-peptidase Rce1 n=1 Tax=Saponaria officinalis TaxID=3572 RepID=A0AAW1LLD6_SAPOF
METLGKWGATLACVGMAAVYVVTLHSPTLIFRRPPPISFNHFLIRRFICAVAASLLCIFLSAVLLLSTSTATSELTYLLPAYGVRADHFWRAVGCSFSLTCLMYAGSLLHKSIELWTWRSAAVSQLCAFLLSLPSNISAWRNLVVAPITEELVFRACMIPLLLCSGFNPRTIVFLCPVFFSLSHLNHLFEFDSQKDCYVVKFSLALGVQLVYTMVFGSYASFLFVRTGHIVAPLVAHIVCNFMGLPVVYSKRGLIVSLASIAGVIGFIWLLIPLTVPALYNSTTDGCHCWQGYCTPR